MPSVDSPKACLRSVAKKIPNSVGARTKPSFTPLRMLKGSESGAIVQNCSHHVIMKRFHDAEYGRRTTDLGQDLEKAISAHKVECLGQVNKGNIKWLSLLSAFFLQLS